jgi:hypothetical protein
LSLTLNDMRRLHERMTLNYNQWIKNAPDNYKEDGFFTSRRPVGVTSRYGQNQRIGGSQIHGDVEDHNWDNDRPWGDISHVTVALATHIK